MFWLISVFVIIIDQLSKWWIVNSLPYGQNVPILGNFFSLNYIHNQGAAFSIFTGKTGALTIISIIVVLVVCVIWWKTPKEKKIWRLSYALLVGGAIGNCIDRIRLGYVVDFFRFPHFAVFNIADSMLVISVVMLCLLILLEWQQERKASKNKNE